MRVAPDHDGRRRAARVRPRAPHPDCVYGGCSFTFEGQTLGLRPVAAPGDRFDHLSLLVGSVEELHRAAERLERAGVTHGRVTELPAFGVAVLSVQDPDDINLELTARLTGQVTGSPAGGGGRAR